MTRLLPPLWLVLLAATVALSVLAGRHDTLPGDLDIMTWAQARAFPGKLFSDAVRAVSMTEVVIATGAVAAVALWFLGRRTEAVVLAVGIALLPAVQTGVKELIDRPRPLEPAIELRAGYTSPSFPAGHVMSPALLYGFLLYVALRDGLPRYLLRPLALWSAFVLLFAAPPNVWLGVHWPSDVLGGWAWALTMLLPMVYAVELQRRRAHNSPSFFQWNDIRAR